MKTRQRLSLAASALALTCGLAAPVMAQEATPWPELMMKMADKNKDGMVTREEYLEMAGKLWDMKHAAMMKADSKMKAKMMDKTQFMNFTKSVHQDPGNIGGM